MLTNTQFTCIAERYTDTVFRVALHYLRAPTDAEDVTQNTFLKLLQEKKRFESEEHIKSWLIRVAINECKNLVRTKWWRTESYEAYAQTISFEDSSHSELFHVVMELPKKYRLPLYLYYYEEYSTQEIGQILNVPKNTVCTRSKRGREMLKKTLREVEEI